jgi:hypothetical protein
MLISFEKASVIILNNIPSIYQDPYAQKTNKSDLSGRGKSIAIDIWYFRQFRFGELTPSHEGIDFIKADGTGKDHKWSIQFDGDSIIKVNSIAIADDYGEDVRFIGEAFALPLQFRKVQFYDIIFQNKNIKDRMKNIFCLADNTFYIGTKKNRYYVIFRFNNVIHGQDDKNVLFNGARIYAFPFATVNSETTQN